MVESKEGLNFLMKDTNLRVGEVFEILDAVQQKQGIQKQYQEDNQQKNRQNNGNGMGSQVHNNMNRQRIEQKQIQQNFNFETKFGRSNRLAKLIPSGNQQQQFSQNQMPSQKMQNKILPYQQVRQDSSIEKNGLIAKETLISQKYHNDQDQSNQENLNSINKFPQKQMEIIKNIQNVQIKNQLNLDEQKQIRSEAFDKSTNHLQNKIEQNAIIKDQNQYLKVQNINVELKDQEYRQEKHDQISKSKNGMQNILNKQNEEKLIQKLKDYQESENSSKNCDEKQNQGQNLNEKFIDQNKVSAKLQTVNEQNYAMNDNNYKSNYNQIEERDDCMHNDQYSEEVDDDERSEISNSELSHQYQDQKIAHKQENISNQQNSKQHQSRPTIGVKQPASFSQRQQQNFISEKYQNSNNTLQGQNETRNPQYLEQQAKLLQKQSSSNVDIEMEDQKNNDNYQSQDFQESQDESSDDEDFEFNYNDQNDNIDNIQNKNPINQNRESRDSDNSESNLTSVDYEQQDKYQKDKNYQHQKMDSDNEDQDCQSDSDKLPSDSEFNQKTQMLKKQSLWVGGSTEKAQDFHLNVNNGYNQQKFDASINYKNNEHDSQQFSQDEEGEGENSYGEEDQEYLNQVENQNYNFNNQNYYENNDDQNSSIQQNTDEMNDQNESVQGEQNRIQEKQKQNISAEPQFKNENQHEQKHQTANGSENTFLDGPQYEDEDQHESYQSEKNQEQLNSEFKIPRDHVQRKLQTDSAQNKDQVQKINFNRQEQNFQKPQNQINQKQDFLNHLTHLQVNSFSTNNPEAHHLMMQNDELHLQSSTVNNLDNHQFRNQNNNQIMKQMNEKEKSCNYSYLNQNNYSMNINEFQIKNMQCLDTNMTENTFQHPIMIEKQERYHNFQKQEEPIKNKNSDQYIKSYLSEEKQIQNNSAISPSKILNDSAIFQRPDIIKGNSGQNISALQSVDKDQSYIRINKLQQSGDLFNDQRLQKSIDLNSIPQQQRLNLQRNFNLEQSITKDEQQSVNSYNQRQIQMNSFDSASQSKKQVQKLDIEIEVQKDLMEKDLIEAKQNQKEMQFQMQLQDQKQKEALQKNLKNLEEHFEQKLEKKKQEIIEAEQQKFQQHTKALIDEKNKLQIEVEYGFDQIKSNYKNEIEDMKIKISSKTDEVELLKVKITSLQNQVENSNHILKQKDQEIHYEKNQKEKLINQLNEKKESYEQAMSFIKNLQQESQEKDQQLILERENLRQMKIIEESQRQEIQIITAKYEQAQVEIQTLKQQLNQLQDQYDTIQSSNLIQQKQENINQNQKKVEPELNNEAQKNSEDLDLHHQLELLLQKKKELRKLEMINEKLFQESDDDQDVKLIENQHVQINQAKKNNSNSQISFINNERKDQHSQKTNNEQQFNRQKQQDDKIKNEDKDLFIIDSASKQKDEFLSQMREESSYLPEYVKPIEQQEKSKIIKKVRFHDDEQLVNMPHKPLKTNQKVGSKRLRQDIDSENEKQDSRGHKKDEDMLNLSTGQEGSSLNMREDSQEPSKQYLDQECEKEFKKAQKIQRDENEIVNPQKSKRLRTEQNQNSQSAIIEGNRRRGNENKDVNDQMSHKLNKVYSEDISDNDSLNEMKQKNGKKSRKPISIKSSSRSASPLPEKQNGSTYGGCNSTSAQSQSQIQSKKKSSYDQNAYGQKMKEHMNTIDKNLLSSNPKLAKMLQQIMKK